MLFHSFEFLIFAIVALTGHALLRGRPMRVWLVLMSYVFYGWAIPWYCALLFTSTVVDFVVAQRIESAGTPRRKRGWLLLSLAVNLGLLGVFKYLAFFVVTINHAGSMLGLESAISVPNIILPIGISFYTFQTLSYTIDVYRGTMRATHSFSTMALYVAFFPQLVAGPIERGPRLMHQLVDKQARSADDVLGGMTRVLWGLMKKVVFADWLGIFVARIYASPQEASVGELVLATYAFAFQIYLDFSAYSDIAIGLSRMMGIRLQENFKWPYLARNLSEFWARWHISLSSWLRDYLYVPLGGSRRGAVRTIINVLVVMFLGGLWHGAATTFILWGLWMGLGLAIFYFYSRRVNVNRDVHRPLAWRDVPGILVTFHWCLLSWVFFRAESTSDALLILSRVLLPWDSLPPVAPPDAFLRTVAFVVIVSVAHILRGTIAGTRWERVRSPVAIGVTWGVLIVILTLAFAPQQEPFIYFQF